MNTAVKLLLSDALDSWKLKTFGCSTYVHKHKAHRGGKLGNHADQIINLSVKYGLYKVYTHKSRQVMASKYESFDRTVYPMIREGRPGNVKPSPVEESAVFKTNGDEKGLTQNPCGIWKEARQTYQQKLIKVYHSPQFVPTMMRKRMNMKCTSMIAHRSHQCIQKR